MSTPTIGTPTAAPEPLHGGIRPRSGLGSSIALRGVLAIVFGVIALLSPGAAAVGVIALFVAWAFVDAVVAFIAAYHRGRAHERWGWFLFEGLVGVAAGVLTLAWPRITLLVLVIFVGARALALGAAHVIGAVTWRGLHARWLHALTGVVSMLFGFALLWQPFAGMLALLWLLGIYAIVFGVMTIALGVQVRALQRGAASASPPARTPAT